MDEFAVERRKVLRYRLNASAMFRWSGPEDGHYQGEGMTRDMSVAGAYVVTATCPPPNAVIQMEVYFPLSDSGAKALMKADMMVLRVEHEVAGKNRSGFSAVSAGFALSTSSERASRIVSELIEESSLDSRLLGNPRKSSPGNSPRVCRSLASSLRHAVVSDEFFKQGNSLQQKTPASRDARVATVSRLHTSEAM